MGVPTFYRWLVTRYPKIVKNVYEHMDSDECIRRRRINEEGDSYLVHDLVDYVNNTDKEHCSDNINGYFDNLYLDMNGIIHCCSHPPGGKTPSTNGEIFVNIFQYIERLFDIIEPKKLLFMAIDGVAPKAKMNQQRSRRFKSILESQLEKQIYQQLRAKFVAENRCVPEEPDFWDSNVITPGTQFMHELSISLKYFIEYKITHDEKWKKIVVIFSDSNVCGEGEYKIYNFIKSQRFQKNYDPNIRHCIHGMDADLIMLSLASHEPYFYILREVIEIDNTNDEDKKHKHFIGCLNNEENVKFCIKKKIKNKKYNKYKDRHYANIKRTISDVPFTDLWNELQILDLSVLREYLASDFAFKGQFSVERCIDDFIFICFLCGNDFLPHLPSISIVGGSIDQLIVLYQNVLPVLGDYLTCEGVLNIKPVSKFMSFIAEVERETFVSQRDYKKRREQKELQLKENMKKMKYESEEVNAMEEKAGCVQEEKRKRETEIEEETEKSHVMENTVSGENKGVSHEETIHDESKEHKENQQKEKNIMPNKEDSLSIVSKKKMYEDKILSMEPVRNIKYKDKKGQHMINFLVHPEKNTHKDSDGHDINETTERNASGESEKYDKSEENASLNVQKKDLSVKKEELDILEFNALFKEALKKAKENENPKEDVELGSDEDPELIRLKYYRFKFHLDASDDIEPFVKKVVAKYLEGLAWVLLYYFQSCPMWHWYYPYYYSPLSSDLVVDKINVHFEKDEPLLPFEQLLSVLPSSSCHCLPKSYRNLMLRNDSPIIDFYPTTFKEEENGKKFKYQWIVLLPFVDKERLIRHATPLHETLTEEEKRRNRSSFSRVYVDKTHPFGKQMRNAMRKFLLELKELNSFKEIKGETNTEEGSNDILELVKCGKEDTDVSIEEIYKKIDTKVPIQYIKDANVLGYFYFKYDDEEVETLKRILNFSSSFSSTCNSSFFLQPEFEKHTSSLLANHVKPKQVLSLVDINNEDRKHRFNAAAARRMILNSLSKNHPHICNYVKVDTYRNAYANQNYYNTNYNFNHDGTLYKYGTTYEKPFVPNYAKPVNNYSSSILQKPSHPYQQQYNNPYNRNPPLYNYPRHNYDPRMNPRMSNSRYIDNHYGRGGHMHPQYDADSKRGQFPHHSYKDHNTFQNKRAHYTHSYGHGGRGGGGAAAERYNQYGYHDTRNRHHYDGDRTNFTPGSGATGNMDANASPTNFYRNNNKHMNPNHRHEDNRRYM